ncbi:hypothetical protein B0T19DRAFT_182155 [Cercophora scortea]|uniref:NACHT domain-containing protein n=1 Tax=Cercophora scortea TaxID=314031 RepID=A0AAE0IMU3_9PEZI|nr:hypothetical protein B0T19DRAFT_182155 [Cercophora scortea]
MLSEVDQDHRSLPPPTNMPHAKIVEPESPDSQIRLVMAISEFAATLQSSQKAAFKTMRSSKPPSAIDIIKLTEELNRDGSRSHRSSWRPFGTRLFPILERICLFSKVGDILVGGSQNMLASGVWAALRVSLQGAMNFLSFFDKLSEMLLRIGRHSNIQHDLVALFPGCPEIQNSMCEYLVLVIELCKRVVSFSQRSLISHIASSLGSSFDCEFGSFEPRLDTLASLIDHRAKVLTIQSQLGCETAIKRASRLLGALSQHGHPFERISEHQRLQMLDRLSPFQHIHDSAWRRERKRGSTPWVLQNATYRNWRDSPNQSHLLISGILGSGKTVLLANIVSDLFAISPTTNLNLQCRTDIRAPPIIVASIFCQYNNKSTLEPQNIFGSIAHQFIKALDDHAATELFNTTWTSIRHASLDVDALVRQLPVHHRYYVVVDALDELSLSGAEEVLSTLSAWSSVINLRLCFSARSETLVLGSVSAGLLTAPFETINMSNQEREKELAEFIEAEVLRRRHVRPICPELLEVVKKTLINGAQGMYLWVVLQLETIFPLHHNQCVMSDSDITGILENLPQGLQESFDRALGRVFDTSKGRKLFEIVAGAVRPMTLDEIRVAMNVQPGETDWNPETLIINGDAMVRCCSGGLLEVDEESLAVQYIHHSALQHLVNLATSPAGAQFGFTLAAADVFMGALCVTYLNSSVLHDQQLAIKTSVPLDVSRTAEAICTSMLSQGGSLGRFASAFHKRSKSASQLSVDLGRVLDEFRSQPCETVDGRQLLEYANENWPKHTEGFPFGVDNRIWTLFSRLLDPEPPRQLQVPWRNHAHGRQASGLHRALEWAAVNGHNGIYRLIFLGKNDMQSTKAMARLVKERGKHFRIRGSNLGDILSRCMLLVVTDAMDDASATSIVEALLRLGACPNIPCFWTGISPLEISLFHLRYYISGRIVELLLEHGANPEGTPGYVAKEMRTPLLTAIQSGSKRVVELLLQHGASPNAKAGDLTPLGLAVDMATGDSRVTSEVSFRVLDTLVSTTRKTDGKREVIDLNTLYRGINHPRITSPLHTAIMRRRKEVVDLLLTSGCSPNIVADGTTPLQLAIRQMPQIVPCLLAAGALPDRLTGQGEDDVVAVEHALTVAMETGDLTTSALRTARGHP